MKTIVWAALTSLALVACADADSTDSQGGQAALGAKSTSAEPQRVDPDVKFAEPTSLEGASCTTLEPLRRQAGDVFVTFTFGKAWKHGTATSDKIVHAKLESRKAAGGSVVETKDDLYMQRTVEFIDSGYSTGSTFKTLENSYELSVDLADGDKFVMGTITVAEENDQTILVYKQRTFAADPVVVPVRCTFLSSDK